METLWGKVNLEPTGRKPLVRITPKEDQRLAELRDCLRDWGELERTERDGTKPPVALAGRTIQDGKEKENDEPNGYMRATLYNGGPPWYRDVSMWMP